jgi:hypothetical protein
MAPGPCGTGGPRNRLIVIYLCIQRSHELECSAGSTESLSSAAGNNLQTSHTILGLAAEAKCWIAVNCMLPTERSWITDLFLISGSLLHLCPPLDQSLQPSQSCHSRPPFPPNQPGFFGGSALSRSFFSRSFLPQSWRRPMTCFPPRMLL